MIRWLDLVQLFVERFRFTFPSTIWFKWFPGSVLLMLLAKKEEHAIDGDARRKQPKVELNDWVLNGLSLTLLNRTELNGTDAADCYSWELEP